MVPVPPFRRTLRDDRWRYSLLAGLAMLPLMAEQAVQSTDTFDLWPVFYAGLIAGFLYDGERAETKRVGIRAGAVAALPTVWSLTEIAAWLPAAMSTPTSAVSALVVLTFVLLVGVPFVLAVGLIGGLVGRWIAGEIGRPRLPAVGA